MPVSNIIYLDNNATTKIDPRVLEAIMPYLTNEYGNPSSTHHFGLSINKAVNEARENVAELIDADRKEVIFTSGATESINLALRGFATKNQHKGKHIVTVETEHKAVLDTCKYLESVGFEITYLPVKHDGLIDLEMLKEKLRVDTILVCVMLSNNEIGVMQPLKEIAEMSHKVGATFMCDATQAVGKIPVNVDDLGIDLMAFSGHKFYAPKGIGCLYIRGIGERKTKLESLIFGGGHENGMRSGTLNVPGIVGIGKACEISMEEMEKDSIRIMELRNCLEVELLKTPSSFVNGNIEKRMYNVSNICFPGIDASVLIGKMKNVAVSNGSACTSAIIEPSHVLKAIGLSDNDAMASIRFSLGRFNSEDDILNMTKLFNELIINTPLKYA